MMNYYDSMIMMIYLRFNDYDDLLRFNDYDDLLRANDYDYYEVLQFTANASLLRTGVAGSVLQAARVDRNGWEVEIHSRTWPNHIATCARQKSDTRIAAQYPTWVL